MIRVSNLVDALIVHLIPLKECSLNTTISLKTCFGVGHPFTAPAEGTQCDGSTTEQVVIRVSKHVYALVIHDCNTVSLNASQWQGYKQVQR